jgi:acyl phosphate:glycerol-3-phosphate acyltransferase
VFVWPLALVVSYLLGTFPTALLVGARRGVDPTKVGSHNPGATNVYRTAGRSAGLVVLAGDIAKGAMAAGGGWLISGRPLGFACWAAAVAGHIFPVTRRFKGGKGVASAGGGALVLVPIGAAACIAVFVVIVKLLRKASVGSLAMCVVLPIVPAVIGRPGWEVAVVASICALVASRHGANIKRLRQGSEATIDNPPARDTG